MATGFDKWLGGDSHRFIIRHCPGYYSKACIPFQERETWKQNYMRKLESYEAQILARIGHLPVQINMITDKDPQGRLKKYCCKQHRQTHHNYIEPDLVIVEQANAVGQTAQPGQPTPPNPQQTPDKNQSHSVQADPQSQPVLYLQLVPSTQYQGFELNLQGQAQNIPVFQSPLEPTTQHTNPHAILPQSQVGLQHQHLGGMVGEWARVRNLHDPTTSISATDSLLRITSNTVPLTIEQLHKQSPLSQTRIKERISYLKLRIHETKESLKVLETELETEEQKLDCLLVKPNAVPQTSDLNLNLNLNIVKSSDLPSHSLSPAESANTNETKAWICTVEGCTYQSNSSNQLSHHKWTRHSKMVNAYFKNQPSPTVILRRDSGFWCPCGRYCGQSSRSMLKHAKRCLGTLNQNGSNTDPTARSDSASAMSPIQLGDKPCSEVYKTSAVVINPNENAEPLASSFIDNAKMEYEQEVCMEELPFNQMASIIQKRCHMTGDSEGYEFITPSHQKRQRTSNQLKDMENNHETILFEIMPSAATLTIDERLAIQTGVKAFLEEDGVIDPTPLHGHVELSGLCSYIIPKTSVFEFREWLVEQLQACFPDAIFNCPSS
ncbi:hypothetical protein BCR33DRAFT_713002, partial [Rhizoclosmatium globosum]